MTSDSLMIVVDRLAEAVTVQAESTVSRVVLRGDGARVVLFAFDTDQELTEHTASVPVLLQVLSGHLDVTAAGEQVELKPGALVHLAARLPHSVVAREPTVLQLTMLQPGAPTA